MAHKATEQEERALAGEQSIREEIVGLEKLPIISMKVVYLGGHPKKFVRLPGAVIFDPDDETESSKRMVSEGATGYDFATEDERGRKLKYGKHREITPDGKRFQMVSHLAHLKYFFEFRDGEKAKQYDLRSSKPGDIAVFKQYLQAAKLALRNPDKGQGALELMDRES